MMRMTILATITGLALANGAWAGGFSNDLGDAFTHSGQASAHTVSAIGKGVAGTAAIVLAVPAASGELSADASAALAKRADMKAPLPISERTYIRPAKAKRANQREQ